MKNNKILMKKTYNMHDVINVVLGNAAHLIKEKYESKDLDLQCLKFDTVIHMPEEADPNFYVEITVLGNPETTPKNDVGSDEPASDEPAATA